MAGGRKSSGIADDADAYENMPESVETSRPRRSGIAEDSGLFEDLLDESTDAARRLDSDWLYQQNGQVFGPVKPRELLEMLYQGDLTFDTPVAPEDSDFQPIRRFGVFRVHIPKVEAHRKEVDAAKAKAAAEAKRRLLQRAIWVGAAVAVLALGSISVWGYVRWSRQRAADMEKQAKEEAIKKDLDALLASVTIEPPLMSLVHKSEPEPTSRKTKKRKTRRAVAKFSGGPARTGELTRQEIMAGVGKAFSGFRRCIVKQIQRDAESVPEQIVLTFSVNNQGKAQKVSLADRFLRKSPLKDCMASRLAAVTWRPYKGEVQNVEYPITIGRR